MAVNSVLKETLKLPDVSQIGIVVKDLSEAINYYEKTIGLGPFIIPDITFDEVQYYGQKINSKWLMGFCSLGSVEMEIIQPISGPSIYQDFLLRKGEGLHHLGFDIDNMDEKLILCEKLGIRVIQCGKGKTSWFAYLGTEDVSGVIFEFIQRKQRRI